MNEEDDYDTANKRARSDTTRSGSEKHKKSTSNGSAMGVSSASMSCYSKTRRDSTYNGEVVGSPSRNSKTTVSFRIRVARQFSQTIAYQTIRKRWDRCFQPEMLA